MAAVKRTPAKTARRAPAQRTKKVLTREDLTAEMVWRACPPLGGPAATTGAIAEMLGCDGRAALRARVFALLNQLAAQGRAQRLYRDKAPGELEWRRQ